MLLTAFFTIGVEANAEVMQRTVNNGNLVMQDVPEIPEAVVFDLARYQNVRSAGFLDWSADGKSVYIRTRFGDVPQIHIVGSPGGRRNQITFFDEPIGSVSRQPGNQQLIFTMDAGGSEFSQIFLFDPISGESSMLTDGESRNVAIEWSKGGEQFAYQSTRRNGKSNDVWMMDADNPESARIVFESPDGTWWGPGGFDTQGKQLLIQNYVSIVNSKVHLLNLATGESTLLAGGGENTSVNLSVGFDSSGEGFFFITDRGGEFNQLAWATMNNPEEVKILTSGINWDVEGVVFSDNMSRGAFVVNANGVNEVYLMDTSSFAYRKVDNLPIGLVGNMDFSPDGSKLALTLNTPATPSDTFVLSLGKSPLDAGKLTRWTYSEVGGLNTSDFIMPELIHYETFDGLQIPAFVYKPKGKGPFPVVVSIHGGPEGQALPGFSSTYQMWLAKLGAAVVVPNVRGSAGYGKSYLQLDNGYKREDSVKDIGSLLDWIATDDDLDENRVAVFGGSYGGYMVLASAVFYSDRLRAAVDVVGISNFVTFLENTQDYRRDLRRKEYGDERIPLMRKHLESISPLNNVQRINIPTLVVQGQNDPRVPVTESLQLVKALRDQGQQVWFMNGLNEGHGFRKKENRDVYQQVTMMFLKKHLLEAAR
jgi:dipeptidyl aminopeptidase/acylaminoacyl peptidase